MPAVVCVFLCVQALLHTDTYTLPVSSCLVDCDRKYSPTCSSSLSKMQSCRCRAEYLAGYLPLLSFSPLPSFHFLLFVPPLHFVTAPSVSLPIPFGLPFVTTPPPLVQCIFTKFFPLLVLSSPCFLPSLISVTQYFDSTVVFSVSSVYFSPFILFSCSAVFYIALFPLLPTPLVFLLFHYLVFLPSYLFTSSLPFLVFFISSLVIFLNTCSLIFPSFFTLFSSTLY